MLARRFLWVVAIIVMIVIAAAFALRMFPSQLMRVAFVPGSSFEEDRRPPGPDYSRAHMWIARPDLPSSPAAWTPPGIAPTAAPRASVFFIHPTSFLDKSHWNAALDGKDTQDLARIFVQSQASAFNGIGAIWAPRYRQATVGAFLTARPDADAALALAYGDVRAAFDRFLMEAPADRPIILAGHSQGSYHLSRLLTERIAGTPLAQRIAAAYPIGWPLSVTIDVPRLGLPPCRRSNDSNCLVSWISFAEPAEPGQMIALYNGSVGPDGERRDGTPILCVNPLTGNAGDAAPAGTNSGSLVPNSNLTAAELRPGLVPARCDRQGLLLIGENPPELPPFVLPGNNFHVFDYALFWANLRADAERRLVAYSSR